LYLRYSLTASWRPTIGWNYGCAANSEEGLNHHVLEVDIVERDRLVKGSDLWTRVDDVPS
jgi:hypothetical protein